MIILRYADLLYQELSKESKELSEKIKWYERKLDEEWRKATAHE